MDYSSGPLRSAVIVAPRHPGNGPVTGPRRNARFAPGPSPTVDRAYPAASTRVNCCSNQRQGKVVVMRSDQPTSIGTGPQDAQSRGPAPATGSEGVGNARHNARRAQRTPGIAVGVGAAVMGPWLALPAAVFDRYGRSVRRCSTDV